MKLYNDKFQNYKKYNIPKAQLILADIPYNLGINAYASNPKWYVDGDNKKGESDLAKQQFFDSDNNFSIEDFIRFCSEVLVKEPKEKNKAPCVIVFCSFIQQFELIQIGAKYGFKNYINLVFRKNKSAEVLKANMRIVGNCEYGVLLYRDKLPKFNNYGRMIFNCFDFNFDSETPRIHPTQKPIQLIENLIRIFTDEGDVVIDPTAGSGVTLLAASNLRRKAFGFEIEKKFYDKAQSIIFDCVQEYFFC